MRKSLALPIVAVVVGVLIIGAAFLAEFGNVAGQSVDPSQTATVLVSGPAATWTGPAKKVGLVIAALGVAGLIWLRSPRS